MIINADCIEHMNSMPPNSVDSIVTDPPYHLTSIVKRFGKEGSAPAQYGTDGVYARSSKGFMGKEWDGGDIAFRTEVWEAALRVAKPGAYLMAFGGTRTFHRMACAIEDAGWEIRDCVMWVYGCLSDDTEVLTSSGWERYHIAKHKEILVYDPQTDVYQWEKPSRWSEYRVESDTAYRIVSDSTDQIVSRNHRCLVERGGVLAFVAAEECAGVEQVPYLRSDVSALPQRRGELLLNAMLREGEGLAQKVFSERHGKKATRQGVNGTKEPSVERRSHIFQTEGQVRRPVNQIRSMPIGVKDDGTEGRLRHGASPAGGCSDGATAVAERVCTSHQLQRNGQQVGELDVVCVERRPQAVRTQPSYLTTLATVTPIKYTGLIFCPTVSTGAFVARRNGKVFITGNSGFPKSHNVSKGIDKAAGAEREVVGTKMHARKGVAIAEERTAIGAGAFGEARVGDITAPATEAAQQWDGWGTALKPAWEPIIMARKALDGTVAENVQKWGVGAINIDRCRIKTDDKLTHGGALRSMSGDTRTGKSLGMFQEGTPSTYQQNDQGRWPANLMHDGSEEVVELFPDTGKSAGGRIGKKAMGNVTNVPAGQYEAGDPGYGDSGSAARFFYCAKANKTDRNEGCEDLDEKVNTHSTYGIHSDAGLEWNGRHPENRSRTVKNNHPTVKPTALMRYLCKMVTPPAGIVLDPFCGSGSTGKGAILEGFQFIGVEKDPEYSEIASLRIRACVAQSAIDSPPDLNELDKDSNQLSMFK